MTPSDQCKHAGLAGLKELAELSGESEQSLINWHKRRPFRFALLILGVLTKKEGTGGLRVGEEVTLGKECAEFFKDTTLAYEQVVVEAVGMDWVLVRSEDGKVFCVAFNNLEEFTNLRVGLES